MNLHCSCQKMRGEHVLQSLPNITGSRGVARNFYMGGPIRTMKVEIDDDEYHRCMDSLYF